MPRNDAPKGICAFSMVSRQLKLAVTSPSPRIYAERYTLGPEDYRDFIRVGASVALTPAGRKGFFRAYETRLDSLVTHPLFEYRVSYRRLLGSSGSVAGAGD